MSKLKNVLQIIGARLAPAFSGIGRMRGGKRADESAGQESVLGESAPSPLWVLGRFSEKVQYRMVIALSLLFLVLSTGVAFVANEMDLRAEKIRTDLNDIAQVVQQLRGEVQGAAAGNTDAATDIDEHYTELMQRVADLSPWAKMREIRTKSLPSPDVGAQWSDGLWAVAVGDAIDIAPRLEGVLIALDDFSKIVSIAPQFGALSLVSRDVLENSEAVAKLAEQGYSAKDGIPQSVVGPLREMRDAAKRFSSSGGNTVDLAAIRSASSRAEKELGAAENTSAKARISGMLSAQILPTLGVLETSFKRIAQDLSLDFTRASDDADKVIAEVTKPLPTLGGIVFLWGLAAGLFLVGLAGVAILMAINAKASAFAAYYAKRERDETDQRVLEIMRELSPIATGDLTRSLTVTEHVTGSISDRVNQVIHGIRNVLEDLRSSTTKVEGAIEDMFMQSETAQRITKDATDQAAASRHASQKGEVAVNDAVTRSNEQRGMMQEVSKSVKRLGEIFQSVQRVVDVLDSVSSYSEVLAINTSLKAEEAGEHGGAFRVIAEEQRKLTDDTKRRLADVTVLVQNMLGETQAVIQTVERVTASMVSSTETWESVTHSLQEIRTSAQSMEQLMSSVDTTAQEQGKSASNAVRVMGALSESAARFKTSNDGLMAAAA